MLPILYTYRCGDHVWDVQSHIPEGGSIKLEKQLDARLYYPLILPFFTPIGVEIMYEMYNPTVLKVEVMKLEK